MHFMSGFAADEFYSMPNTGYDGSADFSVGICGMCDETTVDTSAVLSCYRPTTDFNGWELRSGGAWAVKSTQLLQVAFAETGPAAAEVEVTSAALALPHSMNMRPFMLVMTMDVSSGSATRINLNGEFEATGNNTGGIETALDPICLGTGYANGGASKARPALGFYVSHVLFEAASIKTAAEINDTYADWVAGRPLQMTVAWDHVWYAEDAKESEGLGGTLNTWYSRTPSASAPIAFTADVDDGLRVDYFNNVAFSL
jgi:hypothetical protein